MLQFVSLNGFYLVFPWPNEVMIYYIANMMNFYIADLKTMDIGQNLELKRMNDERKAALAAQFAAEATLRRVHAAQKDNDLPPLEAILAPLEAELKLARQEVHVLS